MSVTAQRSPADKPGNAIISSVLTDIVSKVERGRQEINYNTPDKIIENGTIIETHFVRPGLIASINSKGVTKKGKVTGFSCSITNDFVRCSITVETLK